ncbi:V-type ATP synthase subunit D [Peptoniphilus catoniae]|uniref:V-type ATP synthase subunit D n=1 Tax=Peptoniphilus catoniae TaxID=1660341 RepID=UPI0010FEC931|nr:V-type ATP synthase subunit D [Peptoniphilus catoniae]
MPSKLAPTKANLIWAKSSLKRAKKGYELLDKKRTILIKEMMDLNKRAGELQKEIEDSFKESYEALEEATITMGSETIYEIAKTAKREEPYKIQFRSVMGVELPEIKYYQNRLKVDHSIHKTTTAFDLAEADMHKLKELIYELAEVETSVFKLAREIKKTGKRANALDKIQIPKFESIKTEIDNTLQEKEREDFFRLKKVKDKKSKD